MWKDVTLAEEILPSVAMLYEMGESERMPEGVCGAENLSCARLWMKKLICVAMELRLASMCLKRYGGIEYQIPVAIDKPLS